jgi:hypothetical protein
VIRCRWWDTQRVLFNCVGHSTGPVRVGYGQPPVVNANRVAGYWSILDGTLGSGAYLPSTRTLPLRLPLVMCVYVACGSIIPRNQHQATRMPPHLQGKVAVLKHDIVIVIGLQSIGPVH